MLTLLSPSRVVKCVLLTPQTARISILVSGCYAAWKWKRLAQYDEYHHPGNVKPFGFHADLKPHKGGSGHTRILSDDLDWDPDLESGHGVEIVSSSSYPMAPTPGETTPAPTPTHGRERGGSASSSFSRLAGRMNFSLTHDVDAANAQASATGRRSRASSLLALDTAYDPAASRQQLDHEAGDVITLPKRPASYVSITGTGADRRASYNHTRDPAFDEFVRSRAASNASNTNNNDNTTTTSRHVSTESSASHASSSHSSTSSTSSTTSTTISPPRGGDSSGPAPAAPTASSAAALYRLSLNLKSDVDDALGAAFGWGSSTKASAGGSPSRSSSQSSTSILAAGDPPAIAVGGGAVQGVRSVRDSLGRAPSDGSERAALGNVPDEDVEDEEEEEEADEDEDARRRRLQNVDEASRALLGESLREEEDRGDNAHPELLRPGRPKSEMIEFVITPPPSSPRPGVRSTWGNAYAR